MAKDTRVYSETKHYIDLYVKSYIIDKDNIYM